MDLRRATITDLDAVTELFDLYRVFYHQKSDIHGAREFLKERFENQESIIFLAIDQNIPVGFLQLYPIFSSVKMQRSWLLNDLFVKETSRGKGFGEALLKKAIAFAGETGARGLLLETVQENFTAQRLYEKIGFLRETNYFYYFSIK